MEKNLKSIYKFELIIVLLITLLFFIQDDIYKYLLSIIGFGILLFVATLVYKKKKDTNFFRGSASRIVFAIIVFYFLIIYLLGLLVGFNKTLFSTIPSRWIQGLIPIAVITIITEKLRFILIKNNIAEKKGIYGITILMMLFNIFLRANVYGLTDPYLIFVLICTIIMPIIAQELLSTHMVLNYGYIPTVEYKLIMNLYIYILPIFPTLGDYLYSAVNIVIPFTIYVVLKKYIKTDEDIRKENQKLTGLNTGFITIPIIIVLLTIIILVSGIFGYKMIAIGSNSMTPVYEKGDAIIYEKVDTNDIEEGDIIVFEKNKILVSHRVIKIKEDFTKRYFYTKGDANNTPDNDYTNEEDVRGVVKRVVKYIGYPTVWINEIFRRWDTWEWIRSKKENS